MFLADTPFVGPNQGTNQHHGGTGRANPGGDQGPNGQENNVYLRCSAQFPAQDNPPCGTEQAKQEDDKGDIVQ